MKQFKLKSAVLALYLLVLWLIRLLSLIKDMFSLTVQSINRQGRHINVPSNIASSSSTSQLPSPSTSTSPSSPSPSTLSSSPSLSNLSSSSLSWSSSSMGEFIGTDSGVCMGSSEDLLKLLSSPTNAKPYSCSKRNLKYRREKMKTKQYPLALPLLARTGNLSRRYPWVLHREYVDGRLVLTETRVERHEYFEAEREYGRLVLNLVELCTVPAEESQDMEQRKRPSVVLPAST